MYVYEAQGRKMTPKGYEQVVADLTRALYELTEGNIPLKVAEGSDNKWKGASTYCHQIDVSIEGPKDIILIEGKNWGTKVPVPAFLTFLARVTDIAPVHTTKTIHSKVVTTVGFDPGGRILADYYEIGLHQVRSASEFAMQFKNFGCAGITDSATAIHRYGIKASSRDFVI
jgi:hypothetical protein